MQIIKFDKLDSTNKYIKENKNTLSNYDVVFSYLQTSGKGRNDRVWISNEKENLMFSILIKDEELISKYHAMSILSAYSVRNYLEGLGIPHAEIKWPNDVFIDNKKVCGILLEGSLPEYLIIGIGLNVNQKEFVGEFKTTPTSVCLETNKEFDIDAMLETLVSKLINDFELFKKDLINPWIEIQNHNYLLNKEIKFVKNNIAYNGIVLGINKDYSIKIKTDNQIIDISSGELEF